MQHQRILATVMLAAVSARLAAAPIVVGALESAQCATPAIVGIRPLFEQSAAGWQTIADVAVSAMGAGLDWSIALDGKSLGKLRTASLFAGTQVLQAAPGQAIPPVGNQQQRFAGWCDTPTRRPLAAASSGAFADPDHWRPLEPEAGLIGALFKPFRTQVGKTVLTCEGEHTREWSYGAEQLRYVGGFVDRAGRRLVGISLDPQTNTCDGPPEPGWQSHWFVLDGKTEFLATNLDLVEAVDFDGDGASELLLWRSDYNQDGYLLLDSTLRSHRQKLWSYH